MFGDAGGLLGAFSFRRAKQKQSVCVWVGGWCVCCMCVVLCCVVWCVCACVVLCCVVLCCVVFCVCVCVCVCDFSSIYYNKYNTIIIEHTHTHTHTHRVYANII